MKKNSPAERTSEICAAIEKLVRDVCDESDRWHRDKQQAEKERDALENRIKAMDTVMKEQSSLAISYVKALTHTQAELKEAERKSALHREFWQNSRRKRERVSIEIERLVKENKALKACLSKEVGSKAYDELLEELVKSIIGPLPLGIVRRKW